MNMNEKDIDHLPRKKASSPHLRSPVVFYLKQQP